MAGAATREVTGTPVSGGLRPAPTLADGATLLQQLREELGEVEARMVRVVELVGHVQRSGTVEALEGLPLDLVLALEHRLTGADRGMLRLAADVLRHLPVTFGLWRAGKLSWAQVRGIVTRARHLRVGDRGALDERIAASVDLVDRLDPDQLPWAVDQAVDELDGARAVERREQRTVERNFLWVQQAFDGSSRGTFGLDPIGTATLTNALDAAAHDRDHRERDGDAPRPAGDESGHHDGDEDGEPVGVRSRRWGRALVDLCEAYLAGDSGRQARPTVVVHVNLGQVTRTGAGTVEVNVPGWLPTISTRLTEILAKDADMRAVLFDGKRPLAVSKKVRAQDVPGDTRIAVRARDLGCRWPGSTAPLARTHLHHLDKARRGHDPDHMTCLAAAPHLRWVHRHGWQLRLDPHSGEVTITRRGRTYRSLPWGTQLRRPDQGPDPPPSTPTPRG